MTIRTFWTIFLKILGIWLILETLSVVPQFFASFSYFGNSPNYSLFEVFYVITILLLTIGMYFLILRIFVFKTSWTIDKLKLDRGFQDERIDVNIKLKTIIKVATIVIGGLIFIEALPMLCKQTFNYFQQKNLFREYANSGWIIFYFIKTLIGYLLMTNSKLVSDFIDKHSTEKQD